MNQDTVETLFKKDVREATKGIFSPIYEAVENSVKHAENQGTAASVISSGLDGPTECQDFSQNFVSCYKETPKFTDPITKLRK